MVIRMKAIIVDDEKHVREGLRLLGDWDKHGINMIFEAEDGEEAIKLIIEHCPEIIFTDMRMPKKDGVSLLKWIHASDILSITIVISGYEDYEYMRNAIQYKSFDYILKPIDPDVLNSTIEKAVKEWRDRDLSRKLRLEENQVMSEAKPLYWDHFFSRLLSKETCSQKEINKVVKEFDIDLTSVQIQTAIITIKPLIKRLSEDVEVTFCTFINICNNLLKKDNTGVCFRNIHTDSELVLLLWKDIDRSLLTEKICAKIYQFYSVNIKISLGNKSRYLVTAYNSCKEVYLKHNLMERKKIITENDKSDCQIIHLFDYSQQLLWAIKSGSIDQIEPMLTQIFNQIESSNCLTYEQINNWESEFQQLRKNWLKEYNIDYRESLYLGQDYWSKEGFFSFEKFKEEKRKEFYQLIKTLSRARYQKEKNNIQNIEEYIRTNYQEDINLQEIAERFFLSKEYISRKFKQEFGETITDYLTKIKVEKAKELLVNEHLKIYEVAYYVGYQNEKYFSKVFKKIVGVTPNEYRNSLFKN